MGTRMEVILGSGEHRYRVAEGWAKLPDGFDLKDVAAVAVDSRDHVWIVQRPRTRKAPRPVS